MPDERDEDSTTVQLGLTVKAGRGAVVGESDTAEQAVAALRHAGMAVERLQAEEALARDDLELVLVDSGDARADADIIAGLAARGVQAHRLNRDGTGVAVGRLHPSEGVGVAFSAAGGAPVEADLWRRFLAGLPPNYPRLQAWVTRHAARVRRQLPEQDRREGFWRELLGGWVAEAVMAGQEVSADAELERQLSTRGEKTSGSVFLVGAGPGDPDLLTLRALRVLQMAEVVLYDRLVAPGVLDLVPPEAQRVYVGKRRSHHAVPQETINQMLVRFASEGRRVVRLKGGDPFIFGRGGEEIDQLMEQGIRFEVIPGVTAASGCAAYAGIPLTHRDHAQSCVFTTGHRRGDGSLQIDFEGLVRPAQTIVFYMGLSGARALAEGLLAHGMSGEMPVALIQQGTTLNQRVVTGPLRSLETLAEASRLRAPTLVIVGEVVRLREQLAWFQPRGGEGPFWAD